MRHVAAALVATAVVVGSARAQGPPVSLEVEVPPGVVPSGHSFLVGLKGSIPEGSAQLWAFVRHGRVICSGVPYEEQGTPIVSGTTYQANFIVDALLRHHELGPYTVCAYLGYTTARAVFRIGPPELRALGVEPRRSSREECAQAGSDRLPSRGLAAGAGRPPRALAGRHRLTRAREARP